MNIIQTLKQSIGTGEVIWIVYAGGSNPGAKREIVPFNITDDILWAHDVASDQRKMFKLAKIRLSSEEEIVTTLPKFNSAIKTIADIAHEYRIILDTCGWHVVVTDNEIALYDFWKNGKIKKTPIVNLRRFDQPWPWRVDGPGYVKTSKFIEKAVLDFIDLIKIYSPNFKIKT